MINTLDKKNNFLQTIDAAINYFDPKINQSEEERNFLEIANETMKIEIDRTKKLVREKQTAIHSLQTKNSILAGNLAFTIQEISELEKDNIEKQNKIQELVQTIESRKVYLSEAQQELDSHRRKESFAGIAEKRAGLKTVRVESSFFSEFKNEAEKYEDKLEKALIKIQKLSEELKRVQEKIKNSRFRLGLENKEQAQIGSQIKRLNEVEVGQDQMPKALVLKRPATALIRSKIVMK